LYIFGPHQPLPQDIEETCSNYSEKSPPDRHQRHCFFRNLLKNCHSTLPTKQASKNLRRKKKPSHRSKKLTLRTTFVREHTWTIRRSLGTKKAKVI